MRRAFGLLAILMGLAMLLWLGYNMFVERQPESEGKSLFAPFVFASVFIYVGWKWVFSPEAAAGKDSRKPEQ